MRILHILQSNKLSGAENVVADISMMFRKEHEMAYCSLEGPIRQALTDRDVEFFPISKMTLPEIKRVVKKFKPDVIHSHDVRATILSACVAGDIPLVSHLHGNIEDMKKINLKTFLYMLSSKRVKKVISVSESILEDYVFRESIEKKTICLRNIIYTPRIEKLLVKDNSDYDFDFAYIGRFAYPKNPQRVARVASSTLKECPSAKFGIIGEGNLKEEMEAIFEAEGVSDRVIFTGRLSYPYKALKQAKCMLMCSRFEGTPIAALESMALGVPIVSTPVDGMLELINEESGAGFLCSEDQALSNSVIRLITDDNLQNKMADESIKRFKKINNGDKYKHTLTEIYESTI